MSPAQESRIDRNTIWKLSQLMKEYKPVEVINNPKKPRRQESKSRTRIRTLMSKAFCSQRNTIWKWSQLMQECKPIEEANNKKSRFAKSRNLTTGFERQIMESLAIIETRFRKRFD
jgi:hypothetical protein